MQRARSLIGSSSLIALERHPEGISIKKLSDFPHTLKEFRFLYWLHPFCSNDSATWLIFLQFYFPNGLIVLSNHNLLPPKPKLINIHVRYYVNWNHNHENQIKWIILPRFSNVLQQSWANQKLRTADTENKLTILLIRGIRTLTGTFL